MGDRGGGFSLCCVIVGADLMGWRWVGLGWFGLVWSGGLFGEGGQNEGGGMGAVVWW